MMRSRIHTVAFACAFSIALSMPAAAQNAPRERWVATWGTSLFAAPPRPPADSIDRVPTFFNRTLRQVVRVSAGGSRVRIRLSNENGDRPLVIGSAHIALRQGGGTIDASTDKPLTFNGRSTIVIRPGGSMISDGVSLTVPPLADVAVSLFITDSVRASTRHPSAFQTNYVSPTGDFAGAASFAPDTTFRNWFFLAGVDVVNPRVTGVIVAIGNSITDGTASQADSNSRWPDVLSRRLLASKEPLKAIVNVGIGGNRVVSTGTGPSALQRFDRDVLMQPGITHVIVLEGINDISSGTGPADPRNEVSIEELIGGHQQLVDRAHERGLVIFGATLTPIGGFRGFTPEREAKRVALNTWIRTSGAYDGMIDFEHATRDPADTTRFLPAYDSGDHLHPKDAGYKAMGESIDLKLFGRKRN